MVTLTKEFMQMAIYAVVLKQQFDTVQESHTHKRLGKIWVPVRLVNWEPEYYGFCID